MHLIFAYKYKWGSAIENFCGKCADEQRTFVVLRGSGRQMRIFDAQLRKEFIWIEWASLKNSQHLTHFESFGLFK